jgi:predicted glutamine amidotransferase
MCRFVAYHGPRILLDELLYEPEHSLIHQSVHAHERKEPLNGDGWGVGWYDPAIAERPGLYRTLHPAWNDDNMRHVAPLLETPTFLAHVRAASPGLPVQRLNCHPFRGGQHTHEDPEELDPVERGRRRLLFMHNGSFGAYRKIIRRLQSELDDDVFFGVRGSTDTEHVFAAYQQLLGDAAADPTLDDLAGALVETLAYIQQLKEDVGEGEASTHANFCLSDGERIVASRYTHPADQPAQSLYVGTARSFHCEDGEFHAKQPRGDGAVLVASERLWDDDEVWQKVPQNHIVTVDRDGNVAVQEIRVAA